MTEAAEPKLLPFARFIVYLQENNSSFKPNVRLTVINARAQIKGLGACSLRYLPDNCFKYDAILKPSKPRPAQRFVIVDTNGLKEIPKEMDSLTEAPVIFFGRIKNVTLEKYKDTDDYHGEVSGEEEGWYFYQQAIYSVEDIPFNANTDGFYLGNKLPEESFLSFEKYNPKKLRDSEVAETAWTAADAPYVWSLEEAINYLGQTASINFIMPWEVDNNRITQHNNAIEVPEGEELEDQPGYVSGTVNKKKYVVFTDKIKPKSYSSIYGKSVNQWLEENLLENFTYRFYYTSSGSATCEIINTSLIDTDLFPKAILPLDYTLNSRTTNFSVTEVGETYTQVEVVSNRVLFAGTLTTKNLATGQKTMDRNWEYVDERDYALGSNNGVASVSAEAFRKSYKNQKAYTEYKFVKDVNTDCPITVSPPMNFDNEFTEREKTPFFPFVGVKESTGELIISKSMNSHQTPDTSNLSFPPTLPFGYSDATSKYHLFEPFVSITCTVEESPNNKSIVHLCGSSSKPEIEIGDDIKIKQDPPQAFGYLSNDAKLFEINGQIFEPSTNPTSGAGGSYDWSNGAALASINPAETSFAVYPNFTHWSMIYFTFAGYSKQRISLFKLKDAPGVATRRKVIETDDCEYWIAHPGTFKPTIQVNTAASKQGYAWVPEVVLDSKKKMIDPKVLRNDYKKQKSYLDLYSAFLFLDKKAISIDFTLDGWNNSFVIGQPIGTIKDKQSIVTNSVVESIEYFVEGTTPRIRVSTLIPELPPLKKLGEMIRIEGSAPELSRMSKFSQPSITTAKEEKKTTITRIPGIGGSGGGAASTPQSNLYFLVGGNELPYVSVDGCIHMSTETISGGVAGWSAGVPATLPDGLCWLRSLDNNTYVIGCNDKDSLISYDISSQVVWAVRDGYLTYIEDDIVKTYPRYRICGAF